MKFSQSPKTFAVRKLELEDGPIIIGKLCFHDLDELYEVSSEDGREVIKKEDVLRYFDVTEQQLENDTTVKAKLKDFEVCGDIKTGTFFIDQFGFIRRGDKFVELYFDSKKIQVGSNLVKMFLEPQS